jgi:hypothetical protein
MMIVTILHCPALSWGLGFVMVSLGGISIARLIYIIVSFPRTNCGPSYAQLEL